MPALEVVSSAGVGDTCNVIGIRPKFLKVRSTKRLPVRAFVSLSITLLNLFNKKWLHPVISKSIASFVWKAKRNTYLLSV